MKDKKIRKPQTDKSTSVPVLVKTPKSGVTDHVEIDFRNNAGSLTRKTFGSPSNTISSEYMEMHPSNNTTEKEVLKSEKSDYVEMGVNLSKSERCSSKPIEIIIKNKNDNFQSHDTASSLQMDDICENDGQNTIFPLSLENNSSWDIKISEDLPTKLHNSTHVDTKQQQNDEREIIETPENDDGDYALLLPSDGFENKKEGQTKAKQNYVDLYFPQQIKENNANPKKEEIASKSTYAQIVFPDTQPK